MCLPGSKQNQIRAEHGTSTQPTTRTDLAKSASRERTGMRITESELSDVALSPSLPIHALTNEQDIEPESAEHLGESLRNPQPLPDHDEGLGDDIAQPTPHQAVPPPQPVNARPRDNNPQLPPYGPPPLLPSSSPPSNLNLISTNPASPSDNPQVASYFERRILPPPRPTHALFPRRATSGDIFNHRGRMNTGNDTTPLSRISADLVQPQESGNEEMVIDRTGPELPLETPFALNPLGANSRATTATVHPFLDQPIIPTGPRSHLDLPTRRPRSSPGPETQAGLRRFGAASTMTPISDLSSYATERPRFPYASTSYSDYRSDSLRGLEDTSSLYDHTRRVLHRRGSHHSIQNHTQPLYATPYPSTTTRQATQSTRGESLRRPSTIGREFGSSKSVSEDEHGQLVESGPSTPSRRSGIGRSVKSTRMGMACVICRKRKIKCSGDNPCEECARHNRQCEYKAISIEESKAERERRHRQSKESSDRDFTG